MRMHVLEQEQILPISRDEAWEFFSSPRNLDEITPPELGFKIESCRSEKAHEGQIITYRIKVAPGIWISWVTEIKAVTDGHSFIDEQRFGPYAFWHHRHTFEEHPEGVMMRDLVHYAMPFGPLGSIAHSLFVEKKLKRIFGFRKQMLAERFPATLGA